MTRAQTLSMQAQRPTSMDWQARFIVQTIPGALGWAFEAATQAGAWQGTEGPQSASPEHLSEPLIGAKDRHAPTMGGCRSAGTGGSIEDFSGAGIDCAGGSLRLSPGAAAAPSSTWTMTAGEDETGAGLVAQRAADPVSAIAQISSEARVDRMGFSPLGATARTRRLYGCGARSFSTAARTFRPRRPGF
jgi:hypothetical protein